MTTLDIDFISRMRNVLGAYNTSTNERSLIILRALENIIAEERRRKLSLGYSDNQPPPTGAQEGET